MKGRGLGVDRGGKNYQNFSRLLEEFSSQTVTGSGGVYCAMGEPKTVQFEKIRITNNTSEIKS